MRFIQGGMCAMKKVSLIFGLLLIMSTAAFTATVEDYDLTSGTKATVYDLGDATLNYTISSTDLIQGVTATLIAGGFHTATVPGDNPSRIATLTDGTFAADGLTVIASDAWYPNESLVLEYSFATLVDISDIRIFSGHDGDGARAWINAKIEVDKGAGYYTLVENLTTGEFGQPKPSTSMVGVARIYDDAAGFIAAHVEKVKFTFYSVSHNSLGTFRAWDYNGPPENNYSNQGTILKEIDIIGVTPTRTEGWEKY